MPEDFGLISKVIAAEDLLKPPFLKHIDHVHLVTHPTLPEVEQAARDYMARRELTHVTITNVVSPYDDVWPDGETVFIRNGAVHAAVAAVPTEYIEELGNLPIDESYEMEVYRIAKHLRTEGTSRLPVLAQKFAAYPSIFTLVECVETPKYGGIEPINVADAMMASTNGAYVGVRETAIAAGVWDFRIDSGLKEEDQATIIDVPRGMHPEVELPALETFAEFANRFGGYIDFVLCEGERGSLNVDFTVVQRNPLLCRVEEVRAAHLGRELYQFLDKVESLVIPD